MSQFAPARSQLSTESQKVIFKYSTQDDCIVDDVAGEPVEIVCQVESNPTDLSFRWTFNNSAELIRYIGHSPSPALLSQSNSKSE